MSFGGHRARKRFGQHWLIDAGVLDRIVAAAELQPGERVLEVGPGRGALTARLLASPAAAIVAVELDRDLVIGLRERFGADPRFQLIEGDGLTVPLTTEAGALAQKVVANIPYNITGPLLERLIGRLDRPVPHPYQTAGAAAPAGSGSADPGPPRQHRLLRPERADAAPGPLPHRLSGAPPLLPAATQGDVGSARAGAVPGGTVVAGSAWPQRWSSLLKRCFAARRKMLRNSLAGLLPEEGMAMLAEQAGIRPASAAPGTGSRALGGPGQRFESAKADPPPPWLIAALRNPTAGNPTARNPTPRCAGWRLPPRSTCTWRCWVCGPTATTSWPW